jgi:SulP family sulfate permease
MRKVIAMDATGLNALEDLYERLHKKGKHLLLSAPHTHPMLVMEKAGFIDRLGRENVCPHIDAALARSREILGLPPAAPTDPHGEEKQRLEAARQMLSGALERVNEALKVPAAGQGGARSTMADRQPAKE